MERPLLLMIRIGLLLVLLMPLVVTSDPLPATYFPYIVGKALYGRVLIEIVVGLWIVLITSFPAHRPPRSWIMAAFAIFLMASLLAALAGVSPTRSLWSTYERMQGVVDLLHWFAYVLVAVSVLRTFASWRMILGANVVVSLVVALLGIGQRFGVAVLPHLVNRDRIDITLGNPTYVGAYMMVAILTAAALLAYSLERSKRPVAPTGTRSRRRRRRQQAPSGLQLDAEMLWRTVLVATIGLDFWVLMMAGARGALIGLGAGLILFALVYIFKGPNVWGRVIAITLMVLMLATALVGAFAKESGFVTRLGESNRMIAQLASFGTGEDSVSTRLYSVKMGMVGFAQRPLLGWGPENFAVAYDRNVGAERFSLQAESFDQAHNKLVEELTTKGIVGFLPYVAMWLLMAWTFIRTMRRPGLRGWHFMLLMGSATFGYFVQNLFLFDTPATALQFFVLLGFAVAVETTLRRDPELVGPDAAKEASEEAAAIVGAGTEGRLAGALPGLAGLSRYAGDVRLRAGLGRVVRLWRAPEFHVPVVMAAVVLTFAFIIVRPFSASQSVIDTFEPRLTWTQRLQAFDRSINTFPELGNYPRVLLFEALANNWPLLTPAEKQLALEFAFQEFEEGRRAEPEQWRVYLAAATFFQVAGATNPDLIALAREIVDEASRLAPERLEIYAMRTRQFLVEGDMENARATLNEYLELNPGSRRLLESLITIAFPDGEPG